MDNPRYVKIDALIEAVKELDRERMVWGFGLREVVRLDEVLALLGESDAVRTEVTEP
jgi:hypothetical protein